MTNYWRLLSNSGSDTITFERLGLVQGDNDKTVWRVSASTTFPDRSESSGSSANPTTEHEVVIGQLVVERQRLVELSIALDRWLETLEPFTFELTATPGQRARITLGPDPMLISSRSKPALFFEYAGIALEFRTFTVTDETCLRIAAESLSDSIARST